MFPVTTDMVFMTSARSPRVLATNSRGKVIDCRVANPGEEGNAPKKRHE